MKYEDALAVLKLETFCLNLRAQAAERLQNCARYRITAYAMVGVRPFLELRTTVAGRTYVVRAR